jgi:hypothetical protein
MTLPEYFKFFYKYALRVQPLLPFTWLWSAAVSFWVSMTDGLLPAMRDPLFVEQRVDEIAKKAHATPNMVRTLRELHAHPAIYNPLKIMRELWLDRFIVLMLIGFMAFELYAVVHLIVPISWLWFILFFILFVPILFFYARTVKSEVYELLEVALRQTPVISKITGTKRVILGHTHREMHTSVDQTEVINTGNWSPAFKDPECREAYGKKCFAWVKPEEKTGSTERGPERVAKLYIWKDPGLEQILWKK